MMSIIVMVLITSTIGTNVSADSSTANDEDSGNMVNVTISSNDDESIIAEVPKSYEKEYKQKLKDEEFKESELEKANDTNETSSLAASSSSSTKYLYKKDVIKWVDSIDNSVDWTKYISTPIADSAMGVAVGVITKNSFIGWVTTTLAWSASFAKAKQEEWWKDSAIMILKGEITGVKITVTPNKDGNYPKVYTSVKRF